MKNNLINYAYALFSLGENNKNKQHVFLENIRLINNIVSMEESQQFLKKNFFNKKLIKNFFEEVCTNLRIDNYVIYWLWVIIDNNDLIFLKEICQVSEKYYFTNNNFINIDVFSSFILSKQDVFIMNSFFKKLLKRKVILNIYHKPELLCGIKINFLNKTYDNSIKAKLDILKNKLTSPNNEYK